MIGLDELRTVRVQRDGGVATVVLDRPDRLNAMSIELVLEPPTPGAAGPNPWDPPFVDRVRLAWSVR